MSEVRQPTSVQSGLPDWRSLAEFLPLLLQLALAVAVVHLYAIEGPAFERIFVLVAAGFVFNLVLPAALRLRFFVVLSVVGLFVTLGAADAAWLLGVGLVLLGFCHLPASMGVRVAAIVLAAIMLAVARAGWFGVPWSGAVWPVLGSMFMFRLALYLHALSQGRQKPTSGFWPTVAYFFMLPNVVFPLFPVVDYQTFVRTYYDREHKGIYEQGLVWITRGLLHLILYRLVYQRFLPDPADVQTLGDLAQLMLTTFLLYLRVSGQFHLIVGILHLFGFRLPETHKLYYLAQSFTELWRRINIYWTEFMAKLVFYPTYFRVKNHGPATALVVSTIAVFLTTWALHSYQWFWLRGGFPITPQDTMFWGALGALVTVGVLRELKSPKRAAVASTTWDLGRGVRTAVTFLAFCFLWSLWSAVSVSQWLWSLTLASNVDTKGVVIITAVLMIVAVLGGRDWRAAPQPASKWLAIALRPTGRATLTLLILVVVGLPIFRNAPPLLADVVAAAHASGLNASDTASQHRGYYEQLDVRSAPATLAANLAARSEGWAEIVDLGVVRDRQDFMMMDLEPSRSVMWNGTPFSTNRWGMRDQDYSQSKRPGTVRIALLGPSHVMGDNVPDGKTFEAIVERRLNAEFGSSAVNFEVLNFGMPGYSVLQDIGMLEDRVWAFAPDVVLITQHASERTLTERSLERLLRFGVPVLQPALQDLLRQAGLDPMSHGSVPVPSEFGRSLARSLGLDVRMPDSELFSRLRRISDDAALWAYRTFAEQTRAHGATPAILALNVVSGSTTANFPDRASLEPLRLPVLDLLDVYPQDRLPELQVAPWDDHPNQEANELIAEHLYPKLAALLEAVTSDH